jgi:hypothetical protein
MKVIIAGSRDVHTYSLVTEAVRRSGFAIDEVVSGMALGVDQVGCNWAQNNDKPIKEFPADWKSHGKAAGPIRNRKMAEYADAAIVVWDGESRGTRNMIDEMIKAKKPYYIHMLTSKLTIEDFLNA